MTVDVIEMAGGTYSGWHVQINVDRSSRPLTIRPQPNAAVVWDDTGGVTLSGLFYFGAASRTGHITIDAAGTGGSFRIQNYTITDTGLVWTGYVDNFAMNGVTVRNCANPASLYNGHCVYVSSDGVHRGYAITFNDWNAVSGDGRINNFQVSHTPGANLVTARRWVTDGGYFGATIGFDATTVLIDGWTMAHHTTPVSVGTVWELDPPQTPTGSVTNCHATNCGQPLITAPFIDGGGNVWG
jgi:hypothetical protein